MMLLPPIKFVVESSAGDEIVVFDISRGESAGPNTLIFMMRVRVGAAALGSRLL